jgi:hypothetical protein
MWVSEMLDDQSHDFVALNSFLFRAPSPPAGRQSGAGEMSALTWPLRNPVFWDVR